eukprot:g5965.t1
MAEEEKMRSPLPPTPPSPTTNPSSSTASPSTPSRSPPVGRYPIGQSSIVVGSPQSPMDSCSIPSAQTVKRGREVFTSFTISVYLSSTAWEVQRRYSEFYKLNQVLTKRFKQLKDLTFPPKVWFNNLASKTVETRRKQLESFMRALIQMQPRPRELNDFLKCEEHLKRASGSGVGDKVTVDDFELLKVIGKGSFGKVFLVRHHRSQNIYAMKVLKKSMVKRRKQVEHTRAERRIMGSISHPFIVKLRYAFQSKGNLYLVTDYMMGGELFFHLKRVRIFNEERTRFYAAELVSAIRHLHSLNIVYRDLKPENILLDEEGHIQITDFGLSKDEVTEPRGAKTFCGTPEYLAPEMILNRHSRAGYGHAVDWWSLGTLVFEMLTGWPPFYDKNIKRMCEKILAAPLQFPSGRGGEIRVSPAAKSLISSLLIRNPSKRLEGADIAAHPFFMCLDWDALERREVTPPFRPTIKSETDIRNFEKEFTKETPRLSMEADDSLHEMESGEEDEFQDFTYRAETFSSGTGELELEVDGEDSVEEGFSNHHKGSGSSAHESFPSAASRNEELNEGHINDDNADKNNDTNALKRRKTNIQRTKNTWSMSF